MSSIVILGATGSLGRHVVRQAVAAGHDVTVVVRTPSRLPAEIRDVVVVRPCDLGAVTTRELTHLLSHHDAVINTAGHVAQGQAFVGLVDTVVTSLDALDGAARPACWFLAGVGILDVDASGRQGVDLPRVGSTYWPHRANFERISRSTLDWRILCPGPMVEQAALGVAALRTCVDRLPVRVPPWAQALPGALFLPVFGYLIPQMIVAYADAASLMLENLAPEGPFSRHRVGLALPEGMKGRKDRWMARTNGSA